MDYIDYTECARSAMDVPSLTVLAPPRLTLEDLQKSGGTPACPTLLQFGSEMCAHCPVATIAVSQATANFKFTWIYSDVLGELGEEFIIGKLPAIVIWKGDTEDFELFQGIRGQEQVLDIIKKHCQPRLQLDADF